MGKGRGGQGKGGEGRGGPYHFQKRSGAFASSVFMNAPDRQMDGPCHKANVDVLTFALKNLANLINNNDFA